MNVYEEIQYELWAEKRGKECQTLNAWVIAELFNEEALEIVPKLIKSISRALLPFRKECQELGHRFSGPDYQETLRFNLIFLQMIRPDDVERINRLNELNTILRIAKSKASLKRPDGSMSAADHVTDEKIAIAKASPITSMFSFNKLRRLGNKHTACCPFHDETSPSFYIYDNNTYHCFGCSANGSAIDFFMAVNKTDFKSAVNSLCN